MQLGDLVKPISQMTDEELLEHLRQVKQRRSVERPAHRAHVERAEKKETRAKTKKITNVFEGLTDEDRQKLIEQLQQGELDV
jgi:hypothetical protein